MSTTADSLTLDLQQQRAEIDRAQAETRKFAAEQNKLAEEAAKLQAEAQKIGRDRWLSPLVVVFSGLAAVGGLVAAAASVLRVGGHL